MSSGEYTLLRADRLLDGTGGPPIERAALLIKDGKISRIGAQEETRAPDGAPVTELDYGDATILPGLVDAHTHLMAPGDGTPGDDVAAEDDDILLLQAAKNARTLLHSGVTTIRENGAKNHVTFSLREGIGRGLAVGPKMTLCGRPVTITGGHMWYCGSEADGEDGVRREVRSLIKEGADYIKIMATGGSTRSSFPNLPSYSVPELRAITDEAHRFGKLTAAHCASTQGVQNCLDAEVDMIIHCVFEGADGRYEYRPDLVDRLLEAEAWVNPTLYVVQAGIEHMEASLSQRGEGRGVTQADVDTAKRRLDTRLDACSRMIDAGVKMISGSDSPWGHYAPGEFVNEIMMLAHAGLNPTNAIVSATSASANSIGMSDRAGTLAAGAPADVLIVRGDPTRDLRALWDVLDVIQDGAIVARGVR
ncbi:MAG: amidohydrolase family protein [Chloroflexota bacterium]